MWFVFAIMFDILLLISLNKLVTKSIRLEGIETVLSISSWPNAKVDKKKSVGFDFQ